MPKNEKRPVLAVDLGGTKIMTALIAQNGEMITKESAATIANEGPQAVINRLFTAIDRLLSVKNIGLSDLHSISIAAAGAIDMDKGIITLSPNLPGWRDIPLLNTVRDRYKIDTFLINDAKAAALGEHRFGAGKGIDDLVLLTIGTGIGGGIIIDGELYLGYCGAAGEIGHMTIDVNGPKCPCGNTGCMETLASGTAIAREAQRRLSGGEKSSLSKLSDVTAEKVGEAARNGDALALDVIAGAAGYLGVGLVNLVNIFNPQMIVIGGGVAKMGEMLLDPARQLVIQRAFPISAKAVRIVTARLGNEAGVYGAAAFALSHKSENDNC